MDTEPDAATPTGAPSDILAPLDLTIYLRLQRDLKEFARRHKRYKKVWQALTATNAATPLSDKQAAKTLFALLVDDAIALVSPEASGRCPALYLEAQLGLQNATFSYSRMILDHLIYALKQNKLATSDWKRSGDRWSSRANGWTLVGETGRSYEYVTLTDVGNARAAARFAMFGEAGSGDEQALLAMYAGTDAAPPNDDLSKILALTPLAFDFPETLLRDFRRYARRSPRFRKVWLTLSPPETATAETDARAVTAILTVLVQNAVTIIEYEEWCPINYVSRQLDFGFGNRGVIVDLVWKFLKDEGLADLTDTYCDMYSNRDKTYYSAGCIGDVWVYVSLTDKGKAWAAAISGRDKPLPPREH